MLAAAILAGCEPDEKCRQNMRVVACVTLRGIAVDSTLVGTEFTKWDSITIKHITTDSVLYDNQKDLSTLRFPLTVDTTMNSYAMTWRGLTDTLYIRYTNTMQYVSMACGCIVYHTIDSVWAKQVWMDSVSIINSTVENHEQENIKIHSTVAQ